MQCLVWVVVVIVSLILQLVVAIEVHESPNENATTESQLKSTLPNSAIQSGNDGHHVANNEPGRNAAPVTTATTKLGDYNSSSPSKHQKQAANNHKHSPSYRDTPLSITPTVSSSSQSSSSSSSSSSASSAASSSSGSSFKEDAVLKDIAGSGLVQHQISGYKKRQLYGNSFQRTMKNGTNDRSYDKHPDHQTQSKDFVPSPQLVQFYTMENHHPHHNVRQVDAPYPASVVDSDSKWFGGNHLTYPGGFENEVKTEKPAYNWPAKWEHHKSGKFLWLPNGQSTGGGESDSPFSRAKPKPTPPKGKWKWVPEEEDDSAMQGEKPAENGPDLESKIVSGHHHYFKIPSRDHPYSFDGTGGGQTPFSGGSSDEALPGSTANPLDYFFGGDSAKLKTGGKGDDALKNVSPWKKIIHVLTAAIPIGLIISALTPQVVYVNPNMTQSPAGMQTPTPISATGGSFTNPTRQRSEDGDGFASGTINPLLGFINALSASHEDPDRWPNFAETFPGGGSEGGSSCEEKSFCEMTRLGINHDADLLFKMLWKIANETPTDRARQSGLDEIFRAVKDDDCSRFRCQST